MQHDHEETLKSIYLTFVLDAQKYRLQGDGPCEHP